MKPSVGLLLLLLFLVSFFHFSFAKDKSRLHGDVQGHGEPSNDDQHQPTKTLTPAVDDKLQEIEALRQRLHKEPQQADGRPPDSNGEPSNSNGDQPQPMKTAIHEVDKKLQEVHALLHGSNPQEGRYRRMIDSFVFGFELSPLEIRLNTLDSVVDLFILIEAD